MTYAGRIGDEAVYTSYGLDWPSRLFPYQEVGIAKLTTEASVLLADEMGLGKTIQALASLRILFSRKQVRSALIVCPAGLIVQWRQQIRLWAPELMLSTAIGTAEQRAAAWRRDAALFVTGYESLRSDLFLPGPAGPARRHWDVVVIDEAQRIKNPHADVSIAVKRLSRTRSWALTGTPLENRLDDLISVLDFAAPGRFDPAAMAVGLRRLLGELQLRRRRREVLPDLPPKFASIIPVELTAQQRAAYRRAEQEGIVWLRSLGTRLRITHVLELILRLKQICNFCPESGTSSKFADLRDRVAAVIGSGEKVLIFTQFVAPPFGARRLAQELAAFRPLLLTGEVDLAERARIVDEFKRDPARRLLLLSLRTGGLGLNLTEASCVFHFDRWWNPAVETQAEDRVHRLGQRSPVHVFAYLCADTIEQRIDEILAAKRELFADVVDGVGTETLGRLNIDELLLAAVPAFRR